MKIRHIVLIMLLVSFLFSIVSCKAKPRNEMDQVTITLDWSPNTNHTGLYVAQELGYFAEEGIEVSIMQPGQAMTDQIVASGTSHFGISYQENVIRARSENIPLVSIAAVIQHNTSGFASLAKDKITSPKDF
ncbi:MAG: ABC transporter substrate-binding protein, partial [Candidatus Cloacimonadaceae bacterium]|nr:ABC transporter substrate-binding protein [Candidatus Cloacimonadaceae bacterium]